jgi:malate dehydrogenase (oxaloacetate-decarboxylating)(NADP+)
MFFAAARALADQTAESDLQQGRIFPAVPRTREVAVAVAAAVAAVAYEHGLATRPRPSDLGAAVRHFIYTPSYT